MTHSDATTAKAAPPLVGVARSSDPVCLFPPDRAENKGSKNRVRKLSDAVVDIQEDSICLVRLFFIVFASERIIFVLDRKRVPIR